MTIQFKTTGVCSKQMNVKIDDEGVVQSVEIIGGCHGNGQGVARLVEGMRAEEAIKKMAGIRCAYKPTSCPDQLSKALTVALREQEKRKQA